MGQPISIPSVYHVFLTDYPEIANDSYTVERTNGSVEPGWRIPETSAVDPSVKAPAASIHAVLTHGMKGGWRIFLDNGRVNTTEILGGWRRLDSIWPTRLNGNAEAIQVWRDETTLILDELEKKREAQGCATKSEEQ